MIPQATDTLSEPISPPKGETEVSKKAASGDMGDWQFARIITEAPANRCWVCSVPFEPKASGLSFRALWPFCFARTALAPLQSQLAKAQVPDALSRTVAASTPKRSEMLQQNQPRGFQPAVVPPWIAA